ncbi:hypothetical protein QBC38DRAFT_548024, partial [Podospora fimiseda]
MREALSKTLQDLHGAVNLALRIVRGDAENRGPVDLDALLGELDQEVPENGDLIAFFLSPNTELRDLFTTAKFSVDRLFRHLPADDPSLENHVRHIKDKYPKMAETPWLREKLAQAFFYRRWFILSRERESNQTTRSDESDDTKSFRNATTYRDGPDSTTTNDSQTAESTANSTATSFALAVSVNQDGQLELPDLTWYLIKNVRLQYDEPFECPFCHRVQQVGSPHEWS